MATTQFAMVEELASLIKDNLHSKHLILSTEESLVAALQELHCREEDDGAADTIELQPAGAYHRLLLHRLAEIYGFAHESVGEGEDRHLVLQRCPETAIPSVLVSDMIWKFDNSDDFMSVVLTRNDTDFQKPQKADIVQKDISVKSSRLKDNTDSKPLRQPAVHPAASLKEREAAYRAARERIFSVDDAKGNDRSYVKCRQVPVVAQRMIAHALGQKVQNTTEAVASTESRGKHKQLPNGKSIPTHSRNNFCPVTPDNKEAVRNGRPNSAGCNSYQTPSSQRRHTTNTRAVTAEGLKKEQTGAAKRMFAHALGLSAARGSNGALPKPK
ncbi:hypothetical protein Zm00014a_018270 [Zea mays]|nr:hypothetical protein Zm00014a_018270 [Zea mays]PWZ05311.1 hypothetical protein Zm00014a_018270 [Zea mays]